MSSHLDTAQDEQTGNQPKTLTLPVSPVLPEIPVPDLDLSSIIGSSNTEADKVQKRASNVMKLSQENEKLKAELKAMTDRLEAAERRREELANKEQKIMEAPSS